MAELSPMMQQYLQMKEQNPDTILFFRLGDFYEMFFDDAKLVSKELELVLTGRDCGLEERAPMCGVPYHSYESYVSRLVDKGYKVAICEQMEDPAKAKGLVKREITRIITPGTVIEDSMLVESRNNYLCTVAVFGNDASACFVDASTGALHVTAIGGDSVGARIVGELGRFQPSEIILSSTASALNDVVTFITTRLKCRYEPRPDSFFDSSVCESIVCEHFGKSLQSLGLQSGTASVSAVGAAIEYLRETKRTGLGCINAVDVYTESQFMRLDLATRRNLEISETMRSRDTRGSLLRVVDRTCTAMGKRLMRTWIEQPLLNPVVINNRHNGVQELVDMTEVRGELREALTGIYDLERLMSRIIYGSASPRELRSLAYTVSRLPALRNCVGACRSAVLRDIYGRIDELQDVYELIDSAIVDEPPLALKDGNVIREGYNSEIDMLRSDMTDGKDIITRVEAQERERTGIRTLRIKYNKVFGYCIEVSNSFKDQVPENYIRKQTLTNCERYITEELKNLESRVLGASERLARLEYETFDSVRTAVSAQLGRIQSTAAAVAQADALCSFAQTAVDCNYVRPSINLEGRIDIKGGRHPVVESLLNAPFVPNDTFLDMNDDRCAVITGPNMAGKSTYMRQVALIVLLAQTGSFVPARSADIGICDAIFTRVGASDDLSAGQSTFMVEMSEVANILKYATKNSLLVFDEIGRGTSTFDGMAIARAVLEYVCSKKKLGAKTLFATHYHELTELENQIDGIRNYNTSVRKRGEDITFLRRIVRGCADGSYGVEVAKLAGIPDEVVRSARRILKELEQEGIQRPAAPKSDDDEPLSLTAGVTVQLIDELKAVDVNNLTPIEAMTKLDELSKRARSL
jgi:DNA mismatch repair protein MutS